MGRATIAHPGVNVTNILQAAFSYESFLCSFDVLTVWVCNFLAKDFGAKAAHKILVKLTPGNIKRGSITVPLTSCLTGFESAVWRLTIIVFIYKTD